MEMNKSRDISQVSVKESKKFVKEKSNSRPTVTDTIREILAEGFFNKPKSLAEVKQGLEDQGTFIPITTLSPIALGLVQGKELRRIKSHCIPVSIGKKTYFASHTVAILNNELDRREEAGEL